MTSVTLSDVEGDGERTLSRLVRSGLVDTGAVMPVLAAVEEALAPWQPRPHWGKLFSMPPDVVRAAYPRWRDFAALAASLDPGGTFTNDFTDRFFPRTRPWTSRAPAGSDG
jgi:xylitol oxidase